MYSDDNDKQLFILPCFVTRVKQQLSTQREKGRRKEERSAGEQIKRNGISSTP